MKRLALLFALTLLFISPFASADIPHLISLQGRLTDASNNPITSTANFVFRIYASPTGGTPVWTETQNSIPLDTLGIFSVLLGSANALSIPFDSSYWLEVQVQSGTGPAQVLSPRQRMGSAGYALRSETPWNATGNDIYTTSAGNVGIGTASPGAKLDISNGDLRLTAPYKIDLNNGNTGATEYTIRAQNSALRFNVGSTDTIVVQNTGNVGIGTPIPGAKLQVDTASTTGTGRAQLGIISNGWWGAQGVGNYFGGWATDTQPLLKVESWHGSDPRDKIFQVARSGDTPYLTVQGGGNVGIGQAGPSQKLHVNGNILIPDDTSSGKLMIGNFGSYLSRQASDGSTILQTGQAYLLLNPTGGNVGIGTGSPGQKLDVNGNIAANNGNALLFYQGGEGEVLRLTGNNGQNVHLENINGVFRLVNSPWTADIFHIDQSGNAYIPGQVTIAGGSPGAGKVLTSDANGVGSWQAVSSGVSQQAIPAPIVNQWVNEPYLKDGNTATYAYADIPLNDIRIVTYDLGAVKGLVVVKYDGEVWTTNGYGDWNACANLHFEYSEDGSNWQSGLKSISVNCACTGRSSGRQSITESAFIVRYIRFVGSDGCSYWGSGWARIYEAKIYY